MNVRRREKVPNIARMLLYVLLMGGTAFLIMAVVEGATNISSVDKWAWNDAIGWIDFYTDNVTVNSQQLTGYASSSAGEISLDCATAPVNVCGQSNYKVTNDGLGSLSGWAWNDAYGWISFDCNNHGCTSSTYRVVVDPSNGTFSNWAWNDVIGWISFNCSNHSGCGTSNYKVVTSWIATSTSGTLDSSTFDTGVSGGAKINSVLWRGNLPAQTFVRFQFATSNNSGGPWNFIGSDGTANTSYIVPPDVAFPVSFSFHGDHRYFRYRAILISDQAQRNSPRVDEVIVNWSP